METGDHFAENEPRDEIDTEHADDGMQMDAADEPAGAVAETAAAHRSRRPLIIAAAVVGGILVLGGGAVAWAATAGPTRDAAVEPDLPTHSALPTAAAPDPSEPAEEPLLIDAPVARITCDQLTPTTPVALPFEIYPELSIVAQPASDVIGIEGATASQAGVVNCTWTAADSSFTATVSALPDAEVAFGDGIARAAGSAGTVVGSIGSDSYVTCNGSVWCTVDLLVEGTWIELQLGFGPLGFPHEVQSSDEIYVPLSEAVGRAVLERFTGQEVGPAWTHDPRAFDVAPLCDPTVALEVWGVASSDDGRVQGGELWAAAVASQGYVACAVGDVAYLSATTAGAWAWDVDQTIDGESVQVDGAVAAIVACDAACRGDVDFRGSRLSIWTTDTSPSAWAAQVEKLLAAVQG